MPSCETLGTRIGCRPVLDSIDESRAEMGFSSTRGGAHLARTMMLRELQALLEHVGDPAADRAVYASAIEAENCLGKRSSRTRKLALRHLVSLYCLDPTVQLFRSLRFLWSRDVDGQPLLALLIAYVRDPLLRCSAPYILCLPRESAFRREDLEAFLDGRDPGRFSPATLKSLAQNLASTWTQSGHLRGVIKKSRVQAVPTPGSTAFALLLGYLSGERGEGLFATEYTKLLDCSADEVMALAADASRRGWIVFKRVGTVVEVLFPKLLQSANKAPIREQD